MAPKKKTAVKRDPSDRLLPILTFQVVCDACGAGQGPDLGDGSKPNHPGVSVQCVAGQVPECLAPENAEIGEDGKCCMDELYEGALKQLQTATTTKK